MCVCLCVLVSGLVWRPRDGLISAAFPEMNLRYGRVNSFISSKKWFPPPLPKWTWLEQVTPNVAGGGWWTSLLDRVVASPFASPSCSLPLISCLSAWASRSHGSGPLWQPGRNLKMTLLGHFLPRINTPLPVWLVLPGAVHSRHTAARRRARTHSALDFSACFSGRQGPVCSHGDASAALLQPCGCTKSSANFEKHIREFTLVLWSFIWGRGSERLSGVHQMNWGIFQTNVWLHTANAKDSFSPSHFELFRWAVVAPLMKMFVILLAEFWMESWSQTVMMRSQKSSDLVHGCSCFTPFSLRSQTEAESLGLRWPEEAQIHWDFVCVK